MVEAYNNACDVFMPHVKKNRRDQVYWWNGIIEDLRRDCRRARRRWQRCKARRNATQQQVALSEETYRTKRTSLKKEINRSKARAWKELLQSIESDPWSLPYRVVLKRLRRTFPSVIEMLSTEVLNMALDKLFPHDERWKG